MDANEDEKDKAEKAWSNTPSSKGSEDDGKRAASLLEVGPSKG